jgi:glutathione S-transferase
MTSPLVLVSHVLCPYVQRAAIALREKGLKFERRDINLANKPDWFLALSPTGKTPLLLVGNTPLFESSVICEYLDDVHAPRLHPGVPIDRARHRAWMEFASVVLAAIAALYSAPTRELLDQKAVALRELLERVEGELGGGPYFSGTGFSLVDAAFAPALRYFEVIEDEACFGFFANLPKLEAWREQLAVRPSVTNAVTPDYRNRLRSFLLERRSALSEVLAAGLSGIGARPGLVVHE